VGRRAAADLTLCRSSEDLGRGRSGTLASVSTTSFDIECPHCHKTFTAETIEGSAARYRGFKCTHCKLFVPFERAAERDLLEPILGDDDAG
jgi:hypothetical protein